MTREEALIKVKGYLTNIIPEEDYSEVEVIIKALEIKLLTDAEQRIFLVAMSREEKICKEVCADGDGKDLVAVCHSIKRKVKKALWG